MTQLPPILTNPMVLLLLAILGPLVRDVVVALLREAKRRLLADKDPNNDSAAVALGIAADHLEKARISLQPPK